MKRFFFSSLLVLFSIRYFSIFSHFLVSQWTQHKHNIDCIHLQHQSRLVVGIGAINLGTRSKKLLVQQAKKTIEFHSAMVFIAKWRLRQNENRKKNNIIQHRRLEAQAKKWNCNYLSRSELACMRSHSPFRNLLTNFCVRFATRSIVFAIGYEILDSNRDEELERNWQME